MRLRLILLLFGCFLFFPEGIFAKSCSGSRTDTVGQTCCGPAGMQYCCGGSSSHNSGCGFIGAEQPGNCLAYAYSGYCNSSGGACSIGWNKNGASSSGCNYSCNNSCGQTCTGYYNDCGNWCSANKSPDTSGRGSHCGSYTEGNCGTTQQGTMSCGYKSCVNDSCQCTGNTCDSNGACRSPSCQQDPCPVYNCGNPPDRTNHDTCGGCNGFSTACPGSCKECQDCSRQCGQGRDCGGNCSNALCGNPNPPINQLPNNITSNPQIVTTPNITFSWSNPTVATAPNNFDNFIVGVDSAAGCSGSNGANFCTTLPGTTHSYSYPPSGVSMTPNHKYHFTVETYKAANCNGLGCGTNGHSSQVGGYFCYQVVPGAPTFVNGNGLDYDHPYAFPADSTTAILQWNRDETNHGLTVNYEYRVYSYQSSSFVVSAATANATTSSFSFTGVFGIKYYWQIRAVSRNCNNAVIYGPWTQQGFFVFDQSPTLRVLNIRDVDGTSANATFPVGSTFLNGNLINSQNIAAVGTALNQICQTDFNDTASHQRQVSFRLNIDDLDGPTDLASVGLRLVTATNTVVASAMSTGLFGAMTQSFTNNAGGQVSFYENVSVGSTNLGTGTAVVIFPLYFSSAFPSGIYNLQVMAVDRVGGTLPWTNSGRQFKLWDCQVPVSGGMYDASSFSAYDISQCNPQLYSAAMAYNRDPSTFSYLGFQNSAVGITTSISNTYQYQSSAALGHLVWGEKYRPETNSTFEIPEAVTQMWVQDQGVGTTTCLTKLGMVTLDVGKTFSGSPVSFLVNPYSTNPSLVVNFAGIRDQMQWYQVAGAGVLSNQDLGYGVPVTCSLINGCIPALSINSSGIGASSGLVASGLSAVNENGCDTSHCFYGYPSPERNWYVQSPVAVPASFSKLLNDIYYTNGIGITVTTTPSTRWSEVLTNILGGTGVVFVNGDITVDNTVTAVPSPNYLVVIVSGDITINQNVTQLDGIYLAGGTIRAEGSNLQQLVINGSLFANGRIILSRSYPTIAGNPSMNNSKPSVLLNYRPDYLFLMPQEVFYGLTNWSNY